MKILIISPKNKTVVNFRGDLILDMVAKGHQVFVTGPNKDFLEDILSYGVEKFIEIPFVKDNMSIIGDMIYFRHLCKAIKDIRPDIVLSYTIKPVIYGSIAAKQCGIKKIYSMIEGRGRVFTSESLRMKLIQKLIKQLYRIALKKCDRVIFLNRDDYRYFVDQHDVQENHCAIVNGTGVNMERFYRTDIPWPPVFLMVSRIIKEKGILDFAKAARMVKKRIPKARFLILGGFDHSAGALREKDLHAYMEDGSIELLGEVKDPVSFYQTCSIVVLPSYYGEGLPRTIQEGMACGRPVIATDWIGCREAVENGINGFLVPIKNPRELAEKMYALAVDRERVLAMSDESYRICREKFEVSIINRQMRNIMGY